MFRQKPRHGSKVWPALLACSMSFPALCVLDMPVLAQHTDTEMSSEHDAMLNLVKTTEATHTAKASGNWSSANTWTSGTVPGSGAKVYIPAGFTVTYDVNSASSVRWVRINGKLAFNRFVNTALTVDTIVVDSGGEWEQGTPGNPIASNVSSTVTFSDTGAIDTSSYDPYFQSRGFLAHGKVRICGTTVTPFVKATSALAAGATSINLNATPANWKNGDTLVVTGMRMIDVRNPSTGNFEATSTDERKAIGSISGATVNLNSGLANSRVVEYGSFGLYPYVSNFSRNVTFRSANTTNASRKGHVMFMHNRDVDVRFAAFQSLGRTRKDIDVTNTATSALPAGSNPRARYALHFHRTGKDTINATPSYIQGCAVIDPTSWAYVNHDSYVVFEDNVAHNAYGAAFMTENGAELGAFRRNLASTTKGRGFIKDGTGTHDLARSGTAFWFQGGNLTVENNVATGSQHGYSYFQRSSINGSESNKVLASTLIDPEAAGGLDFTYGADTPIMRFKGNVAVANVEGMFNVDNEINGIAPTDSVLEDFTVLNSHGYAGIRIEYYRNFTFRNVKVLRDSTRPPDSQWSGVWAINANHLVDHLYPWETRATDRHDGVYIRGYWNGIDNDDGDLGVSNGSPERIAKHEVLDNSVNFVGPGVAFANTGTLLGQQLVRYIAKSDVVPFPTFSPPAGKYTSTQTVSISAVPGATIYYVIGNHGYQSPSVESRLRSGTWTQYTGPITISSNKKLIAIAIRNGHKSRPRNGHYTIAPGSTAPGPNLVSNPSFDAETFDTQTPSGWSEAQYDANWNSVTPNASYTESYGGSASGARHGTHWSSGAYRAYTYQVKTGLANGLYTLRAKARRGGTVNVCFMEAKDFGGSNRTVNIPVSSSYQTIELKDINVTNSQATIGFWSDASANAWAYFDDVEFFKQ